MRCRWIIPFLASVALHAAAGLTLAAWIAWASSSPPQVDVASGTGAVAVLLGDPAEPAAAEAANTEAISPLPAGLTSLPSAMRQQPVVFTQTLAAVEVPAAAPAWEGESDPDPAPLQPARSADLPPIEPASPSPDSASLDLPSLEMAAIALPAPPDLRPAIDAARHSIDSLRDAARQWSARSAAVAMAMLNRSPAARATVPDAVDGPPPSAHAVPFSAADGIAIGGAVNEGAAGEGLRDAASSGAMSPGALTAPRAGAGNRAPRYPDECRRRGQQGVVVVLARIDAAGRVTRADLAATSGVDALDRSALDAIRDWRFEPATDGRAATASQVRIPVEFVLKSPPESPNAISGR